MVGGIAEQQGRLTLTPSSVGSVVVLFWTSLEPAFYFRGRGCSSPPPPPQLGRGPPLSANLGKVQFPLCPRGGAEHPIQEEKALGLFHKGIEQIPGSPRRESLIVSASIFLPSINISEFKQNVKIWNLYYSVRRLIRSACSLEIGATNPHLLQVRDFLQFLKGLDVPC